MQTRRVAVRILENVEKRGAYVSQLLSRESHNPRVQFPLLQTLVKGTLEWRSRLDRELSEKLKLPVEKLPFALRQLLRIAAYQLLLLEQVPVPIVIKETVALAREGGFEELTPAIRDVLHALSRERNAPNKKTTPSSTKEIAEHFGHPEWLVDRWQKQLGTKETIALCEANNRPWPVSVRANTLKCSVRELEKKLQSEKVVTRRSEFVPDCIVLEKLPRGRRLTDLRSFNQGLFQVQDESAALVGLLVAPMPGELIFDLCAAPGGKATHLASMMRNKGKVIALDRSADRLRLVKENAHRLGTRIIESIARDALQWNPAEKADRILLDAPCSGFGVLGRKSDIRWAKSPANIEQLAELQLSLLQKASQLLKPGGRLVYSTCTIEPAENEKVVEKFLKKNPSFSVEKTPSTIKKELVTDQGFLRSFPHVHGIGGAFAAVLKSAVR